MPMGGADLSAAEHERGWSARLRLAVEAGAEAQARAIAAAVLAGTGIPLLGEPGYERGGWGWWLVSAQLDLSPLPSVEPDTAWTRFSYVAGQLAGAQSWSARVDEASGRGQFEWPPSVWEKQPGQDDELGHPAIRAARIEIAARTDAD